MSRFTLRDLFWLTLVAALLLGWRMDWVRLTSSNAQYRATIEALKGMAQAAGWQVQINEDTGKIEGATHSEL